MVSYIIIGAILALPLVLGLFLRVNTSHLFLSLLSGELLQRYFQDDVVLVVRSFIKNDAVAAYSGLIILLLPMVLTALFLRHTLSKGKAILNAVPLLITGIVFVAFAVPLLPEKPLLLVTETQLGKQVYKSTDLIVGLMVLLQLLSLWLLGRFSKEKNHK